MKVVSLETWTEAPPDVRAACRAKMDECGLSLAQASRQMGRGVSPATLSRWLSGNYDGDVTAVAARVEKWLNTRHETQEVARSLEGAGLDLKLDTRTSGRLATAFRMAQATGDIVLVHGPSGRGKTMAARAYFHDHSGVVLMTASRAMVTMSGLLLSLSEAAGLGPEHRSALAAERQITSSLRDRGALIIVDEAHHLREALLDELRCIRDTAGCGLALVGNDSLHVTLQRCPQILGRVFERVHLRTLDQEDVVSIATATIGHVPTRSEFKPLMHAARGKGGLHTLRRVLAEAWRLARARVCDIDADILTIAASAITGCENHAGGLVDRGCQ